MVSTKTPIRLAMIEYSRLLPVMTLPFPVDAAILAQGANQIVAHHGAPASPVDPSSTGLVQSQRAEAHRSRQLLSI
jgi:hypothetical protein